MAQIVSWNTKSWLFPTSSKGLNISLLLTSLCGNFDHNYSRDGKAWMERCFGACIEDWQVSELSGGPASPRLCPVTELGFSVSTN